MIYSWVVGEYGRWKQRGGVRVGSRSGFWAAVWREDTLPFVLALGVLFNLVVVVVRSLWGF